MTKEQIAQKLKEARLSTGLTQLHVSSAIERPQQTIAAWEAGRSQPDANTLLTLLKLYGISPNTFFEYDISSLDVTAKEKKFILRYRSLDAYGKKLVDTILDHELQRCENSPSQSNHIDFPTTLTLKISDQPASAGTGVYLGPDGFSERDVKEDALTRQAAFGVPVSGDSMEPLFHDGDIILVTLEQPEIGDIALITLDGCGYVKKIGKRELLSLNRKYAPIPMNESIRINGKVIGTLSL